MGVLERNVRKQCSRVKLKVLKNTGRKELHGNVKEYVLKGSALYTDALRSYNGLSAEFAHQGCGSRRLLRQRPRSANEWP